MSQTEGVDEYPWVLCQCVYEGDGKYSIDGLAELTEEQFEELYDVQLRLRSVHFGQLHLALKRAFEELNQTILGEWKPNPKVLDEEPLPIDFEVRLTAFLATLSACRRRLEALAALPGMAHLGAEMARFDDLFHNDKWYRLAWELRNIDQHSPPASDYVHLIGDSKGARLPLKIMMSRLGSHFEDDKRWNEVETLWEPVPTLVDLGELMDTVMSQHLDVATKVLRLAQDQLVSDAEAMCVLYEKLPENVVLGIYRATADESEFGLQPMDFSIISDAMASMEEVRAILGEPPLFPTLQL